MNQKGNVWIGIIIGMFLAGGLFGAYYLGTLSNSARTPKFSEVPEVSLTNITPSPTSKKISDLKIYTSTKLPENSLPAYSINYPSSWTLTHKREDKMDLLTITKDKSEISIYQAPFGGGRCVFEANIPDEPNEDLRNVKYIQIESKDQVFRRFTRTNSPDPSAVNFDFCGSANRKDFYKPTYFGGITYKLPIKYDESILEEMDSIVKSLEISK